MKKIYLLLTIFMVVGAIGASALASISASDIQFGDDNQVRSNPEADDDEDQVVNATAQITITNDGNESIQDIAFDSSTIEKKYNLVVVDIAKTVLAPSESTAVTVMVTVPEDFPAVDEDDLEAKALEIGTITFKCNASGVKATSTATMQAENQLEINKATFRVKGNVIETISRSGKEVNDLKPGDEVEVTIEINNNFDDKDPEDLQLEDISITLENDDLDIDESEDISSIDPDDMEEVTITFEIDEDQDDGTYEAYLRVEAEDENGALHGEVWTIEFEVVREDYEIDIRDLTLEPSTVDNCEDIMVELEVEIKNIGQKDDDEIEVEVIATNLGFRKTERDLELDQNDEETLTFRIPVDEGTSAGTYYVEVGTYYKGDEPSHTDDITLTVTECKKTETPVVTDKDDNTVVVDTTKDDTTDDTTDDVKDDSDNVAPIIAGVQPVSSVESSGFTGSTGYMIVLVVAVIVAVFSLILLFTLLMRQRNTI